MKKFIAVAAAALAVVMTFGLAACGGDEQPGKYHTKEQWETAFDTISTTDYQMYLENYDEQTGFYQNVMTLGCDKANNAYMLERFGEGGTTTYLHKKGDRYYEAQWDSGNMRFADLLSPTEFAARSEELIDMFGGTLNVLIKSFRDDYDKFNYDGNMGGHFTDADGNGVDYYSYECKNYSVYADPTDESGDPVYTIDNVVVSITDSNELCDVTLQGMAIDGEKVRVTYSAGADIEGELSLNTYRIRYPEVLESSFVILNVDVDVDDLKVQAVEMQSELSEKTITCAANGKLSGDVEINGVHISQFTLTDDYGEITVSGGGMTLTGACDWRAHDQMELELVYTVPVGDVEAHFTFVFVLD